MNFSLQLQQQINYFQAEIVELKDKEGRSNVIKIFYFTLDQVHQQCAIILKLADKISLKL